MKKIGKATVLAGIIAGMAMTAVPLLAAGPYGGRNCQAAWRQNCVWSQAQYSQQARLRNGSCVYANPSGAGRTQAQVFNRARLRDGSCVWLNQSAAGSAQQRGNTYGPGDGTGNGGSGPKDGTGYGAPSKK